MDKSIKCLKTHFLVKNLKFMESKVKMFVDSKFDIKIKKNIYIFVHLKWYFILKYHLKCTINFFF